MSLRKYQAILLIATISISALFPSALFAEKAHNTPLDVPQVSSLSPEVRQRFLKEKQQLKSLGNLKEYANVEVQWNNEKQKPSEIRNLRKKASKDIVGDTRKVLRDFSSLYNVSIGYSPDLRLEKNTISKLTKEQHTRIKQFHNNLEIVGGEIVSHIDKDGFIYQIDGIIDETTSISTVPAISSKDALAVAKQEHGKKAHFQVIKKPELVLYKFASAHILAYRYTIGYDDPVAHMGQWIYYIDANTGKRINAYNLVDNALVSAPITGTSLAGEGGGVRTLTGAFDTENSKYYIYDDHSASGSYIVYNASSNTGMYTDAGYSIANRMTPDWGTTDPTEISAGYNIAKTLEYYNIFWFWTDDIAFTSTGQTYLPVLVHYSPDTTGYNNAFWYPGDGLYIGDGDGISMKSLATLDIIAHEFGHAWTDNTSNLIYQYEQGALNESFSDISGVNVELYAQQSANDMYPDTGSWQADWFIGEDMMIGEEALRDMRNPANTATVGTGNEQPTRYKGAYWYFGDFDNGGVHHNSSVQNFFYYLLSEGGSGNNDGILYGVDGIGIENARRIAHETNTHFVTSTTDYKGVRQAWIDAANSIDPSFVPSVKAAWNAVGVVSDPIFSASDESFENGTDLPIGWITDVSGSGAPWQVTTTTGALGNNSLVSWPLSDNSSTSVSWSGVTDAGYMTFYWRTSSEANYDTLNFYIDGVEKNSWSGLNPWSFYSEAVTSGLHTFTWKYDKDISFIGWLDQAGIDAIYAISLTGTLSYGSDTGSGQYVSGSWFYGLFNAPTLYDYIVFRSDGQMSKGSASGVLSFPIAGMPEWSGSISLQYRDANGFLSQIFTQSFLLDSVAPSAVQITAPLEGGLYNTGSIALSWNPATDTGAGLAITPYVYLVSTGSGFENIVASGAIGSTGADIPLPDGMYFMKVQTRDLAGNTSISPIIQFSIDTVAPSAPTDISVNHGTIIDANTQTGVTITGSGGVSEHWGTVYYMIQDNVSGSITGTGLMDSYGSFSFSNIDVSPLADGLLNVSVYIRDPSGNIGDTASVSIGKSVIPADGNLRFLSGSYTNTGTTDLEISAVKPVSYTISGDGLIGTVTGTIAASGSIIIPISFTSADENKIIRAVFTDDGGTQTIMDSSIILDTTPPTLSIGSHANGVQVTGSVALMTGSVFDANGIASATLNSISLLSSSNWSKNMDLVWGNNIFTLMATDNAGNSSSLSIAIERMVALSNTVTSLLPTGIRVDFDTDMSATGVISYGTDALHLDSTKDAVTSDGLHHSATLTGLVSDTRYYYTSYASATWYASSVSPVHSFHTLKIVDIADLSANIGSTGAVVFSGVSSTGSTVFQGTGSLSIRNADNPADMIGMSLSGLVVIASGTGGWDGIMESPTAVVFTGVLLPESDYALTGSVYKAGNNTTSLVLSGQTATVWIYVGTSLNGRTLHVYRSDSGTSFNMIDSCTVSVGICQFQTDHFSYFAFGVPSDSTPNTFAFIPQTGAEPSTTADSNTVTVSGINTPATINISGWSYSINNLAYTTTAGTVSDGDTVKVRIVSSASYSTVAQATLTVGGVSATFSVTTKPAPIVSGGGGGGGSSSSSYTPPPATTSNTGAVSAVSGTPTAPSVVSRSGFMSSNPIVSSYGFPKNERIPQKVAAELNFFITKLMGILDKKAAGNIKKKDSYNQQVLKYLMNRVKQTSDVREKRIMEYIYKRYSIVASMKR